MIWNLLYAITCYIEHVMFADSSQSSCAVEYIFLLVVKQTKFVVIWVTSTDLKLL